MKDTKELHIAIYCYIENMGYNITPKLHDCMSGLQFFETSYGTRRIYNAL